MIGETLSHYRISASLGAGGMGEVYRATDTHLGREVAIKVLPPEVGEDEERLARFRREAHLLAALNHPHIAAIYGLEEVAGKPFLVMELVEGEDLGGRLGRGPIPVVEALEIAEQIAEALETAHEKGIVHRDLKPANVKLTSEGKAKVLDFGLAKAWAGDEADGSSPAMMLSQSPTLALTSTIPGVILGTAAYMSPEQARGKSVDRRADIWAFGVLVWEMLTGERLFSGDTVTDVIAAVVTKEPDLEALPPPTPPSVIRLIERCLRKDPRARLPDIGAARLELQDVLAGKEAALGFPDAGAGKTSEGERRSRRRERWIWVAVGLAAFVAALTFDRLSEEPSPRLPAGRFVIDAPAGWQFRDWGFPVPSPDGSQIVFEARPEDAASDSSGNVLWIRPLEADTARQLPGTEGEQHPFWSPDGLFIGFFADGEIRKLNLSTGTVQRICAHGGTDFVTNAGATWSGDGRILFVTGVNGPETVYTVPASGGEPEVVLTAAGKGADAYLALPQFLPDGKHFTVAANIPEEMPEGVYVSESGAETDRRLVVEGDRRVRYADGYFFFVQDGTLLAQPFDTAGMTLRGDPVALASSVGAWNSNPGVGWFGVSPRGTLAYYSGRRISDEMQLAWVDRQGNPVGTIGEPGEYGQISLSPDGRRVALERRSPDSSWDLWVMDLSRGVASRVTTGEGAERNPVWSPDGRSIVFSSFMNGETDMRRKGLRAGDPEVQLVDTEEHEYPEAFSPDGRDLFFVKRDVLAGQAMQSIWRVALDEGSDAEPVENAGFFVDEPSLSPDGRWLAYASRESDRSEVYIEAFEREGERIRVSVDGGGQPKWRGDGQELFFTNLDGELLAVGFRDQGERAEVDLPTTLFTLAGFEGPDYDDYAPSADGQQFLVKVLLEESEKARMYVVTNWQSLLQ